MLLGIGEGPRRHFLGLKGRIRVHPWVLGLRGEEQELIHSDSPHHHFGEILKEKEARVQRTDLQLA